MYDGHKKTLTTKRSQSLANAEFSVSMCHGVGLVEQSVHEVHRLVLLAVHYLGIDLRHADISVPEKFGRGVEVCSEREHHRGEGMPCRVERMLGWKR